LLLSGGKYCSKIWKNLKFVFRILHLFPRQASLLVSAVLLLLRSVDSVCTKQNIFTAISSPNLCAFVSSRISRNLIFKLSLDILFILCRVREETFPSVPSSPIWFSLASPNLHLFSTHIYPAVNFAQFRSPSSSGFE